MKKDKLLLAVASVALIMGTSAFAQQEHRTGPAEKAAPSASKPNAGAPQQNKSEPGVRSGQPGRAETTGQAPQERPNAGNKPSAEEHKAGPNEPERANRGDRERSSTGQNGRSDRDDRRNSERDDRSRSTTGQGTPNDANRRNSTDTDRTTIDRDRVQGERNENRSGNESRSRTSTDVSVNLSEQQRTRIHDVIVKERGAPRVNNVEFSLSVGTPVPRTVKLVRVPSTIFEIEPAWRGFEYFLVGDELVIVDPRNMEIVAVVPA